MHRLYHVPAFKNRGLVGVVLLVPVVIMVCFSNPVVKEGSVLDLVTDLLGWFFFVTYATFRLWATLYLGGCKDIKVQTQGPYSVTRNPLYVGSFCLALSTSLFAKSISLSLVSLVAGAVYSQWIVRAEEEYLESEFGEEYIKYCRRTPRFLPSFSLYCSDKAIPVDLRTLKLEARRLWAAALIPIGAEILMHLRMAPWWPRLFTLP